MLQKLPKRFSPLQITKRFNFFIIVVTFVATLIMVFTVPMFIAKLIHVDKKAKIHEVVDTLVFQLEGSYNDILARKDALDVSPEHQLEVLNSELQPFVNLLASSFPQFGMGYYSRQLNSVLAINPEFKPFNGLKVSHDIPYFNIYKTKKPEFGQLNTSKGWNSKPIIWYAYPLIVKGEVVGHVWANSKTNSVYAEFLRFSLLLLLAWLMLMLLFLYSSLRLSKKIKKDLAEFAASLVKGTEFNSQVLPELEPLKITLVDYVEKEKELQQRFEVIFSASPSAMALLSLPDCKYVDVNHSFEKIMGCLRNEVIGLTPDECDNWFDINQKELLSNAFFNNNYNNIEVLIKTRTKKVRTVLVSLSQIQMKEQQFIIVVFDDITQRKEIEKKLHDSNELFKNAFQFCPFPLVITALDDGNIIEVNENFLKTVGYQRDEVIGATVLDLNLYLDLEQREKIKQELLRNGSVTNFEVEFQTKSGQKVIVLLSSRLLEFGGTHCSLNIANDITELRRGIEERTILNREITRLDYLNTVGQMASGIGHEVRNPMTTVRGFLQLLTKKETDDKKKEYYNLMIDELDRANSIITEFLSLVKDRSFNLKPSSLNTIISSLVPLLNSDALVQDKCIVVQQGVIPEILLSEKEIRQLLINLVRNAVEASPPKGSVTISTYQDNDGVILSVKDEGIGIPPEVLDKIGTPFITTKDRGTGLGLSVCYNIAEKHNAKISVETGPSGTTICARFKPSVLFEERIS